MKAFNFNHQDYWLLTLVYQEEHLDVVVDKTITMAELYEEIARLFQFDSVESFTLWIEGEKILLSPLNPLVHYPVGSGSVITIR